MFGGVGGFLAASPGLPPRTCLETITGTPSRILGDGRRSRLFVRGTRRRGVTKREVWRRAPAVGPRHGGGGIGRGCRKARRRGSRPALGLGPGSAEGLRSVGSRRLSARRGGCW